MKQFLLILLLNLIPFLTFSQSTYNDGSTEYIIGETYKTTGKPKVKRSASNKSKFLKSKGLNEVPQGYEIDHIVPLSQGGTDDPSNMQLLTIEEHKRKTARERSTNSTYSGNNSYTSSSTYSGKSSYTTTTTTSTCGALTQKGTYCKRKVKDGGRCSSHK